MNEVLPLTIYVFCAFGLAYIVGHAVVTRGLREWAYGWGIWRRLVRVDTTAAIKPGSTTREPSLYPLRWLVILIECPSCCGFWEGLAVGWYLWHAAGPAVIAGLYTTSTNFFIGRATGLIAKPSRQE